MKRPTQQDVAELAGVSRAAVSYVINGRDEGPILISEETRQKILAAAHQLGYEPNAAAVSLRSQMTHTIGLLIPDMFNPHYWQITRGVEEALHENGYDLLLMSTSLNPEREHTALRSLLRRRVDGLILVLSFVNQEKQEIQTIIHRKSPVVLLGGESNELDTVNPHDEQGTLEMLRHLAAQGHRRIALLYGVAHRDMGSLRLATYQQFMQQKFGPGNERIEVCGPTMEEGYQAALRLLDYQPRPTAIVVINDMLAMAAMRAIASRGLSIPGDISLVGFDDIDQAAYLNPPLTTVKNYAEELGRTATRLLFDRISEPERLPQHLLIPGKFTPRSSTGPVRNS